MKCNNCGNELNINDRFCNYCGENNPNYKEDLSQYNNQKQKEHNTNQNIPSNWQIERNSAKTTSIVALVLSLISVVMPFIGFLALVSLPLSLVAMSKSKKCLLNGYPDDNAKTMSILALIFSCVGIVFFILVILYFVVIFFIGFY